MENQIKYKSKQSRKFHNGNKINKPKRKKFDSTSKIYNDIIAN